MCKEKVQIVGASPRKIFRLYKMISLKSFQNKCSLFIHFKSLFPLKTLFDFYTFESTNRMLKYVAFS